MAALALRVALAAALALRCSADLYVLGLFPTDPLGKGGQFGDQQGRAERAEHFRLAAQLINDKSDGWYDELLPHDTVHIKVADCEDVRGCLVPHRRRPGAVQQQRHGSHAPDQ